MSINQEEQAALERLRLWIDDVSSCRDIVSQHDLLDAARIALREHHADDTEPVTEEWYRSIGGKNTVANGTEDDVFHLEGGDWWTIQWGRNSKGLRVGGRFFSIGVAKTATRGDVRRLCRSLGVDI